MRKVVNHRGHCVRDIEQTQRFYEEVLGFEPWRRVEPPEEMTTELLDRKASVVILVPAEGP